MVIGIWILVALGLALWSLLAWGLHALLRADHQWLGELEPLLARVPFGPLLDAWVPGWQGLAQLALDSVQWALGWVGAAAPALVWMLWAAGALLLIGGGALLSLLVALLRGGRATASPAA